MKKEELDEEEYYVEKTRQGLSETIRKANWGPLIFYAGLAVTGSFILLFVGVLLGPPLLFVFLALTGILDVMSILNARAYGWPGDIITESCELIGFRRIIMKFPDGRERMNEGDLYYDTTVGENGVIPIQDIAKYLGVEREDLPDVIKPEELSGGILKLHLKSNYGRGSSSIFLIHVPAHVMKVHSTILTVLVAPTEKKLTANGREWPTFAGAYYNPFSTKVEDQYIFLKQAPKIADFLYGLVATDELQAENEALYYRVEGLERRIAKLLQTRDSLRDVDEGIEETGGTAKKWYEESSIKTLIAFISGASFTMVIVTILHFLLGVV